MLLAACRGEFPMPIVRLVESLAWGESDPYGPAADTLAVGSSSGADMLAGIFFGIEESLRE
jgi:hypothetical protein